MPAGATQTPPPECQGHQGVGDSENSDKRSVAREVGEGAGELSERGEGTGACLVAKEHP